MSILTGEGRGRVTLLFPAGAVRVVHRALLIGIDFDEDGILVWEHVGDSRGSVGDSRGSVGDSRSSVLNFTAQTKDAVKQIYDDIVASDEDVVWTGQETDLDAGPGSWMRVMHWTRTPDLYSISK